MVRALFIFLTWAFNLYVLGVVLYVLGVVVSRSHKPFTAPEKGIGDDKEDAIAGKIPPAKHGCCGQEKGAKSQDRFDLIKLRHAVLLQENSGYLKNIGSLCYTYLAAVLIGAGWMLNDSWLQEVGGLQLTRIIADYPNAAVPPLLLAGVSVAYVCAFVSTGYYYMDNRIQLLTLEKKYASLAELPDRNDIDVRQQKIVSNQSLFATPLITACLLPPIVASSLILYSCTRGALQTPGPSYTIQVLYAIVLLWWLYSIFFLFAALFAISRRINLLEKPD